MLCKLWQQHQYLHPIDLNHHRSALLERRYSRITPFNHRERPPCLIAPRVSRLSDLPRESTPDALVSRSRSAADAAEDAEDTYIAPPVDQWCKDELLMCGCEPGRQLRVAVLLSGGVDSSLTLRLLKAAGHQVKAFYLQIWFQEDFRNFWDACPWEEDLDFARKVCEAAGVELEVVPLTREYWDRVVSTSVEEIRAGRTPNPDMLCNSRVKFGAFYDYLEREHAGEFDRVASGHYARVVRVAQDALPDISQQQQADSQHLPCVASSNGGSNNGLGSATASQQQPHAQSIRFHASSAPSAGGSRTTDTSTASTSGTGSTEVALLCLTPDAVKDQTYFLAHLSQAQLSRVMFPLGGLTKPQVRKLAAAADLANKNRKDSQGICFLGKVKFGEFVKEHLGEWPGLIVEAESGAVLGQHQGYWFYTVGQRGGIKLPGGPWYVVYKDRDLNLLAVSKHYYDQDKVRNAFVSGPFNWTSPMRPDLDQDIYCKVRHGPHMYLCRTFHLLGPREAAAATVQAQPPAWSALGGSNQPQPPTPAAPQQAAAQSLQGTSDAHGDGSWGAIVVLDGNDQGLAAGQYAVFYQNGYCLGSAKIMGQPPAHA
mmetsp:Transcript_35612/g.79155  ORF Transcript_35612/g.79155 Transcript_35612/m.79155 type:complete len:597 (+) Transcript_35612:87-1877(+)